MDPERRGRLKRKNSVVLEQTESLTRRDTDGNGRKEGELFTLPEGFLFKDTPECV